MQRKDIEADMQPAHGTRPMALLDNRLRDVRPLQGAEEFRLHAV